MKGFPSLSPCGHSRVTSFVGQWAPAEPASANIMMPGADHAHKRVSRRLTSSVLGVAVGQEMKNPASGRKSGGVWRGQSCKQVARHGAAYVGSLRGRNGRM